VGVAYGSPTRLVERLIEEAVRKEPLALDTPTPIVVFDAFGDNSLNFDVHFWVEARSPMSVQIVQSKIRYAIDDAFREHDLIIAFPQRDIHLDSLTPIEVRMVDAADSRSGNSDAPGDKS
jgi:small-conductance mechanosensitive channel